MGPVAVSDRAKTPKQPGGIQNRSKFIQNPFQGNGRVYVVSEAAALRQFLCFLPVLGRWQGSLHGVQTHRRVNRDRQTTCLGPFSVFQRFRHGRRIGR